MANTYVPLSTSSKRLAAHRAKNAGQPDQPTRFAGLAEALRASGSPTPDRSSLLNRGKSPMTAKASAEAPRHDGYAAARDRNLAVMQSKVFAGREIAAGKLMAHADLTADEIIDLLSTSPGAPSPRAASARAPTGKPSSDAASSDAVWARAWGAALRGSAGPAIEPLAATSASDKIWARAYTAAAISKGSQHANS